MIIAAGELLKAGSADVRTTKPATQSSFNAVRQVDAGVLNIGDAVIDVNRYAR